MTSAINVIQSIMKLKTAIKFLIDVIFRRQYRNTIMMRYGLKNILKGKIRFIFMPQVIYNKKCLAFQTCHKMTQIPIVNQFHQNKKTKNLKNKGEKL